MGENRPSFQALLTSGRPKQTDSSWFCSHTVQAPANPNPLRSHSMASKPRILRRAVWNDTKGGEFPWPSFNTKSFAGQMMSDGNGRTPVTFCLIVNWNGPVSDFRMVEAEFFAAIKGILSVIERDLNQSHRRLRLVAADEATENHDGFRLLRPAPNPASLAA